MATTRHLCLARIRERGFPSRLRHRTPKQYHRVAPTKQRANTTKSGSAIIREIMRRAAWTSTYPEILRFARDEAQALGCRQG
jgi:hypothetical protein